MFGCKVNAGAKDFKRCHLQQKLRTEVRSSDSGLPMGCSCGAESRWGGRIRPSGESGSVGRITAFRTLWFHITACSGGFSPDILSPWNGLFIGPCPNADLHRLHPLTLYPVVVLKIVEICWNICCCNPLQIPSDLNTKKVPETRQFKTHQQRLTATFRWARPAVFWHLERMASFGTGLPLEVPRHSFGRVVPWPEMGPTLKRNATAEKWVSHGRGAAEQHHLHSLSMICMIFDVSSMRCVMICKRFSMFSHDMSWI